MELQNPMIENGGVLGTNGACMKNKDGEIVANTLATISQTPWDL